MSRRAGTAARATAGSTTTRSTRRGRRGSEVDVFVEFVERDFGSDLGEGERGAAAQRCRTPFEDVRLAFEYSRADAVRLEDDVAPDRGHGLILLDLFDPVDRPRTWAHDLKHDD